MLGAQGWVPGSLEPFLLTRQEPESPHSCPAVQNHPGPSWMGIHGPEGGLGVESSGLGLRARQSSQVPGARGQGRGPQLRPLTDLG